MGAWSVAGRGDGVRGEGNGGEPALQFSELAHDFGRVTGGEVVHYDFIFTNTGRTTLEIKKVQTSCGCVVLGAWPRSVAPGARGSIPVSVHTAAYSGRLKESVTVESGDPSQPPVRLGVVLTIWRPIEVQPQSALFEFGPDPMTNAVTLVSLINNLDHQIGIERIESSHDSLATMLKTNEPGRKFELEVRMRPPWPRGNLFGRVLLRTSSSRVPVVEVPVFGILQRAVSVTPSELVMPAERLEGRLTQILSVRNFWTNALSLSEAVVTAPGVSVALKETVPGRLFEVWVTYPEGFEIPAKGKVELRMRSNHPQFSLIRIPVVRP